MKTELKFKILETIVGCKSIHDLKQKVENHLLTKELLFLEEIYG